MFVVIEIQKTDKISTIVNNYDNRQEAESRYHEILKYAAVSNVNIHSAVMLTSEGYYVKSESYTHGE